VRFTGKTALVTGSARGIGAAIATRLASEGARVAICDLDAVGAAKLAEALSTPAKQCIGQQVDLADLASVKAAVAEVTEALGPIDVLVNNAGIDRIERFLDSEPATWDRLINVNLRGTIAMCHEVAGSMTERGSGRIVNIASDAGRVGSSGEVVYSGTKGGVIAFSKGLAREVAKRGVTVNVVCPGPTDTALLDQVAEASQKLYDGLARAVPMGRIATPDDIAPAVAFFASDEAGYVTGQTLSVSGGLTMA
jgi:2-hydroxycyclohexanecarboxyl-CoA dehydrogenase